MMRRIAVIVFTAAAIALAADRTFSGTVTDSMCGASPKGMNMGTDPQCVAECVKGGGKYALWDGNSVYVLSDQKGAAPFAAKKVTVKGTLDQSGKTIQVTSIAAAK
jgi:hypothetical protein